MLLLLYSFVYRMLVYIYLFIELMLFSGVVLIWRWW